MNDNCEELCPSCKGELYDSDSKEVENIVRSIKKYIALTQLDYWQNVQETYLR